MQIGVFGALGILFVALKLTGVIAWDWIWVTAPFWGGIVIFMMFSLIAVLAALIISKLEEIMESFKETLTWAICIVLCVGIVFGVVVFADVYTTTLKQECGLAAIEQNYNAVEIQAICDRRQ